MANDQQKLNIFKGEEIEFVETMEINDRVECDVYRFVNDANRDLGIIHVKKGGKTPLQKIMSGEQTIEGYISGKGKLVVEDINDGRKEHEGENGMAVEVKIGQTMQWIAAPDSELIAYEICYPPYNPGRFENLEPEIILSKNNIDSISLKEAALSDAGEYLELEKKVRGKTYFGTRSESEFIEKFNGRKIYLFRLGGAVIGHLAVIKKDEGSVSLSNFVIDPEYQGKGYARKIAGLISAKIKDANRFELAVHPENAKAIHLYESFGFKIIGRKENYCGDGEPRLIMELINK